MSSSSRKCSEKIVNGLFLTKTHKTVTNLGIVVDRNLTMAYQVSKIVRICTL